MSDLFPNFEEFVSAIAREVIKRINEDGRGMTLEPGTVLSYQNSPDIFGASAVVELDSDPPEEEPHELPVLIGVGLTTGQRVMVLFDPPQGGYVWGVIDNPDALVGKSFVARLTEDQTVSSGGTGDRVVFDAVESECPDLMVLDYESLGRIRVLMKGTYLIGANVLWEAALGAFAEVAVHMDVVRYTNGGTHSFMGDTRVIGNRVITDSATPEQSCSRVMVLDEDDTLEVRVAHEDPVSTYVRGLALDNVEDPIEGPTVFWAIRLADCGEPLVPVPGES